MKGKLITNRKLFLIFLFFLFLAIFRIWTQKQKTLAQPAEPPPSLVLTDAPTPPSNLNQEFSLNLNSGDEFDLFVYLYPNQQPIIAADIEIDFEPQTIEILGKTEGQLFSTYQEPVAIGYLDQASGKIALGGVAFDTQTEQPTGAISGPGEFVRFRIKVNENLNSPQVTQLAFNPQSVDPQNQLTTDTNLVALVGLENNPEDVLGEVHNFKLIINQPGDINGDRQVNLLDFYLIARFYGQNQNFELRADINRDGQVDLLDFYQISRNYGGSY